MVIANVNYVIKIIKNLFSFKETNFLKYTRCWTQAQRLKDMFQFQLNNLLKLSQIKQNSSTIQIVPKVNNKYTQ